MHACIPIADTQLTRICRDGHCLLAAIYCCMFRSLGRDLPATICDIGPRARALWMMSARKILVEGDGTASGPTYGTNARGIMLDCGETAEEYLALMYQNNPRPEAWGRERELHVLATLWRCRICTLLLRTDPRDGSADAPLVGPMGHGRGDPHLALQWRPL